MARIRSIKPDFWNSEDIAAVSRDARLMFIGMWNFADDKGSGPANPKGLKMKIFPGDEDITSKDIQAILKELSASLIALYEVEDKVYYHILGWSHQRIDKPQPAKYPLFQDHSENVPGPLPPDRIGRDRIGRDSKDTYSEEFESFWKCYPKKTGKGKAFESWKKLRPPLETCIEQLEAMKKSSDWKKDNGQFIPHPATWLNQRRWEDEVTNIKGKEVGKVKVREPDEPFTDEDWEDSEQARKDAMGVISDLANTMSSKGNLI